MQKIKPQISVLLARGSEEMDISIVTRTLRRAGFPVVVVGLTASPAPGAYGLALAPDRTLNEVRAEDFRAVVLPGGAQGVRQLDADPRVHALLRQVVAQGGYVLALETAYQVAYTAGVLNGQGTTPASLPARNEEAVTPEGVSMEGPVILGRASGAVQEAAQTLAAVLEA